MQGGLLRKIADAAKLLTKQLEKERYDKRENAID